LQLAIFFEGQYSGGRLTYWWHSGSLCRAVYLQQTTICCNLIFLFV